MSGNEYLANLDYIEEVEKLKEGYESEAYWSEEESDKKTLIRMTTGSLKKQSVLTVDSSNDEGTVVVYVWEKMWKDRNTKTQDTVCGSSFGIILICVSLSLEVEVLNQQASAKNVSEDESDAFDTSDHDTDDEDYVVSTDEARERPKLTNDNCQRSYVTRSNARIRNGKY